MGNKTAALHNVRRAIELLGAIKMLGLTKVEARETIKILAVKIEEETDWINPLDAAGLKLARQSAPALEIRTDATETSIAITGNQDVKR